MTDEQCAIYRRMTTAERIAVACSLHDFAFERVLLSLKREAPERPESELVLEACRRFLGDAEGVL